MVEVGTATHNEKELKRDWPVTEGLTAGTTKQEGTSTFLEYDETFVPCRYTAGL